MNKIPLIIRREYLSRVKKRSFLLTTFLVPLFLIVVYVIAIVLTARSFESSRATVHVIDQSGLFQGRLTDTRNVSFVAVSDDVANAKADVMEGASKTYLLIIPERVDETPTVELFSSDIASLGTQEAISSQLEEVLRDIAFEKAGVDRETVENIRPHINVQAKEITPEGEKQSSAGAAMGVAMALSVLIYICLLLYGTQVMRGIIEEKTNRIVEVIISSVKPFQLMMGKIIGIGLVGLTQFILWIVLSTALMGGASIAFMNGDTMERAAAQQTQAIGGSELQGPGQYGAYGNVMQALDTVDFQGIITAFLLYFFGGYLLYSALFAAVGSAVDSETETQQFMFPITIPLLFTYILSFGVLVNDPDGPLSFWLSMIPLTSPIAMLVRLPFGVPGWQLALSLALLIGGFILTTWIAARIYRVGILMYGKRASYKELVKWFRYKG